MQQRNKFYAQAQLYTARLSWLVSAKLHIEGVAHAITAKQKQSRFSIFIASGHIDSIGRRCLLQLELFNVLIV
jgi:hypothetical protein